MSSHSLAVYPDSSRKFNINWRTFGLISLVMTSIVLCFLWIIADWNEKQFESNRLSLHAQYQGQLERLIENSSENMIQLSSAVSFNNGLMEAIINNDRIVYETELESLDWNLQTDSGMSLVGLYNLEWQNLFAHGEHDHSIAVQQVVEDEQPYWRIDCDDVCRILTYTALLHQGDVIGVIVLEEPLSNVMLRFQRVANIDTGLLGDIGQRGGSQILPWQRSLMALTNPEESRDIIRQASEDYSLQDLSKGIALISVKDALYELKAMPLQDTQVVVISDVSHDYQLLNQSKGKNLQISAIALVLGEFLLLAFLWRPLRRIKMSEQLEGFALSQAKLLKEKTLALSKAESLSGNLCDSMSAAVLILGKDGKVEFANNYFAKLLGLSSQEINGRSIYDFVSGESAYTSQRVSDVYTGLIDEYEHIGRLRSCSNQVHRMLWRYVPSYFSRGQLDEGLDSSCAERSVIAIGMPLMLPTLESEQEWLDRRDPKTGMLNRQAAYDLIERHMKGSIESEVPRSLNSMLYLYRFNGVNFSSPLIEQAYIKLNSVFNQEACTQDDLVDASVASLDENEIAVICRIDHSKDPLSLNASLLDLIQNLSSRFELKQAKVSAAFTCLSSSHRPSCEVIQSLHRKL